MELPNHATPQTPHLNPVHRDSRRSAGHVSQRWHLRLVEEAPPPHPILERRDPDRIRRAFPTLAWISDRYFRAEVEGMAHAIDGASLVVGTHNAGMLMPDTFSLAVAFWRRFGLDAPAYALMHEIAFRVPVFGDTLAGFGAIPATHEAASVALRADAPLLVCPGGDLDSLKPFRDRHRIMFGRRRGFIRLALREQVPIVPAVSVGAHETMLVLNDGRGLARRLRFDRMFRIKTVPMTLSFPLGLTPAGLGAIPLPSKIRVRVLPRIELAEPPSAADDPFAVERCFRHVRDTMQTALTDLASKRKRAFFG